MISGRYKVAFLLLLFCSLLAVSCSKEEKKAEEKEPESEESTISYISEEITFGIFFDKEGVERTITLEKGQKEFTGYLFVHFPEDMEIASVEWRLELPPGVEVVNDRYHKRKLMSLGFMDHGISETFNPCFEGPKVLIHELTFSTEVELKNATIAILPSKKSEFLGVAECSEGYPKVRAASYKAVVNPDE